MAKRTAQPSKSISVTLSEKEVAVLEYLALEVPGIGNSRAEVAATIIKRRITELWETGRLDKLTAESKN